MKRSEHLHTFNSNIFRATKRNGTSFIQSKSLNEIVENWLKFEYGPTLYKTSQHFFENLIRLHLLCDRNQTTHLKSQLSKCIAFKR